MRYSWREIRINASEFSKEWAGKGYEKGEKQIFYYEFFKIFGIKVQRVASFEKYVKKLNNKKGFIDLFMPGLMLVEQKSKGGNLIDALDQGIDYFEGLRDHELPKYLLLSDFQNFELHNLEETSVSKFKLSELSEHIEKFGFIVGVEKKVFQDQDPVNIKAASLISDLYDELSISGYRGEELGQFLIRIVFCLFADDTGIFEQRDQFYEFIDTKTKEDGSDTGEFLSKLFEVLNTPLDARYNTLGDDINQFQYVNGELFAERLRIPSFNFEMRQKLIKASAFDWSQISPAIFGSLFQTVMENENKNLRRKIGAHYTTERNILKVIKPLFMDELWTEFLKLKQRKDSGRKKDLKLFQKKLSELKFLDPACGCGNFLIISYRELRKLEIEIIREIYTHEEGSVQLAFDAKSLSMIDVDQFYGFELEGFPSKIAEVAMWMMDHLMNNQLSLEFGQTFIRLPLSKSPQIFNCDALEINWNDFLGYEKCNYIFGNPPFVGHKFQSESQRKQLQKICKTAKCGKAIDYVSAWFLKASEFMNKGNCQIAFVATNSISQGEQVSQLWPNLFREYKVLINFAHRTFAWGSEARGKANVHVVIIGLINESNESKKKSLYSYDDIEGDPTISFHKKISPYLIDASKLNNPNITVKTSTKPINGLPILKCGSKPVDGGNYIFKDGEKDLFINKEPLAQKFIKPFIGSREFINGGQRWILTLKDAMPNQISDMPNVKERIQKVKEFRLSKTRKATKKLGETPLLFEDNVLPTSPFFAVPQCSANKREYIPMGWLEPPFIPSDKLRIILNFKKKYIFSILVSSMHMSWVRHFGGRIKSDFQYSVNILYNNFPLPKNLDNHINKLNFSADEILKERNKFYPNVSYADLYDPISMPTDLKKSHIKNDKLVEKIYRKKPFESDLERAEYLLNLYEKLYC